MNRTELFQGNGTRAVPNGTVIQIDSEDEIFASIDVSNTVRVDTFEASITETFAHYQ